MDNIVSVKLDSRYASTLGVWQYDYGQVLRITGPELPPAVEVQFSLDEKSGETLSRVGTTVDGVTEVKIPDELLTHSATSNYRIYAYIYLTDETSGNTKYEITIPVRARSKPTSPTEDPETDPDLFRETVVAVNTSAERAENAARSATESAASAEETLIEIKRVTDGISEDIENANTAKSELSDTINSAEEKKKELEPSIGKAGEAKTSLDSSISSAEEKKLALDATVEQANAVDASLKEQIGSAEQIQANVEQIGKNTQAISSLNEDLGNIIYKELINGFDKDNAVDGYLMDNGNVASNPQFVTSDYFDVQENKTYYALQMVGTVKHDHVSYICFYDSSKTFITGGYFLASSCTSPNGSKYARVTFPSDETTKARCMFTSIETPDKYYPFGYEYSIITKDVSELKTDVSELKTNKIENRLYGKTMAILGDSMAKGHTLDEEQTWAYKIANRNGMVYKKLAVNGTFITTGHGDSDANCLLEQAKKINNNPDIIVIHMGTNDRNKNVELGTWTISNTDTTNLFGALRVAFTYLAENFPLAQVMFITPYYYQEQADYIGSIEKACMAVGWHCKNNKQGGIWAWNTDVKNALFLDIVHLNEVGQERASYEYEGFMRTFM